MRDTADFNPEKLLNYTFYRGRVGLYAALRALGIGEGDEVAIQAFTCVAVPEAVLACGARPVYIDVCPGGVNMSPESLSSRVTRRTKAVVVQHTFGVPADMPAIMDVLREKNIPVVEDCCHTFLSEIQGRRVGSFGCAAFYSFEWGKPLVAGIGGALVVNDAVLDVKIAAGYSAFAAPPLMSELIINLQYSAYSLIYTPKVYWSIKKVFHALSTLGFAKGNYNVLPFDGERAPDFGFRMPSSIKRRVASKARQIRAFSEHSNRISKLYREELALTGIKHVSCPQGGIPVYARFPIFLDDKEAVLEKAQRAGVEISGWYRTPVHPLSECEYGSACYEKGSCPQAEAAALSIVSLPVHEKTQVFEATKIVGFLKSHLSL